MGIQAAIVLVLVFSLMLAMSIPVSFSIISASLLTITMLLTPGFGMLIFAQKIVNSIDNFTFLAVPFFVLAGLLVGSGGIAKWLTNLATLFLGRVSGSLAMTNITDDAMSGSIPGLDVAAATAIEGVILLLEEGQGYDKGFSAAVNIAIAPVGQLTPPTASFTVYSAAGGDISVTTFLMVGWVPGLLQVVLYMVVICIHGAKHGYVMKRDRTAVAIILKTVWKAIPSLFPIIITIGDILSDYLTPTEASGVTVMYVLLLSVFVYKSIQIKNIPKILVDTAVMTTVVILIIGASSALSFILSFTGLPRVVSSLLSGISDNRIAVLLIINMTPLIVGTFIDMVLALLIFVSIFLPIAKSLGMGPIQFDVMIVTNLPIGVITPPMGNVLPAGCSVTRPQVEGVMEKLLPFFLAIVAALIFITFVPGLSMRLPDVLGLLKQEDREPE